MMDNNAQTDLLTRFNRRESDAFGKVYSLYYDNLHYFASNLYRDGDILPCDVVHEVFLSLWQSKSLQFDKIESIKAYIIIAIRNNFRTYLNHGKYIKRYIEYTKLEADLFETIVFESEFFSSVNSILKLLPNESAEIMSLLMKGYTADEVAEKIGICKQTVYNKKYEALAILKKKIGKDELLLLLISLM